MTGWLIPQREPVIEPGQLHTPYDDARAGAAHVLQIGDTYRLVYWGTDGRGKHHLLQAESTITAPNDWRSLGGPLAGPQTHTVHNWVGPSFPFLLPVTDSHWLLYFAGWGRTVGGKLPNTTGVLISGDSGRSWRYHDENPVLPLDRAYDSEGTGSVWVLLEEGTYRMYYTAIAEYYQRPEGVRTGHGDVIPRIGIAYAESDDGLHWHKPYDDYMIGPRGFSVDPYEYICSKPCVLRGESGYTMWVNTFGTAYRVHRLVSADGIAWKWARRLGPDGELGTGSEGSFDDRQRCYPSIVQHGKEVRCWYTGNDFGVTGMGYAVHGQ